MYVGHVGLALALGAHRRAPPLWLLVFAAQGCDWGDVVRGVLRVGYGDGGLSPHSLPLVAAGAAVAALLATMITRRRGAGAPALLAAVAYASHWPADYLTGIKPTWPGGPWVGEMWYAFPGRDLVLEAAVVTYGWWLWRRSLRDPRGPVPWALLAALLALQLVADLLMGRGTLLL
ncbi:hypothetical protein J421_2814 [Gemmatirosa kalamazoonensis]|uniref:Membrane-bound metal-dependent hydrolase n=1 Tax=Gemmatirosa kalamazoonensis TaxID=861299 RepID=W0RHV3_9BACT|nr:hypothetical protein [Gemmatirosa kalamazoonensis]AHG90351.1 hypothetical protein J421_2814 [Gemmatirosa kalamazoonensis]